MRACPWSQPRPPSMDLPARCDVLIVGATAAGLSLAEHLAQQGATVVLTDPADHLGADGSGTGPGQVLPGIVEHPWRLVAALGDDDTRALWSPVPAPVAAGWEVEPSPLRWLAFDPRETPELARSVRAGRALGQEMTSLEPPPLGALAAFEWSGCGLLQPGEAAAAVAARAIAGGATIAVSTPIVRITDAAAGLVAHLADRTLQAELVVYAGGVELVALEPWFHERILPVREQALLADTTLDPGSLRIGWGGTFARAMPGSGLLLGGCRWAAPSLGVGETAPVLVEAVQARLEAILRAHFSPHAAVLERWAWIETHTCDQLPIVGPLPGSARRIAMTGFAGNPWGLGGVAAAEVALALLGSGSVAVRPRFAASRFL